MEEKLEEQEEDTFLFPLHPLSNIAITSYLNDELRFNGVSRDNLPRIKGGAYMINLGR